MTRRYETAILFDPELPEERRKEFLARLGEVVASYGCEVLKQDDWGSRKLAYPIRKRQNAYYTFLTYTGRQGVVEEMERLIKIADGVLRWLTCRQEGPLRAKAAPASPEPPEAQGAAEGPGDAAPAPAG